MGYLQYDAWQKRGRRDGDYVIITLMTQLLKQALERLRELPEADQDRAAADLMQFVNQIDTPQIQLSDEQLAEVNRRLAKKKPKTLTMAQFDKHLKRRGI